MADAGEQERNESLDGPRQLATLELLGGRVCLDFVNSVDPRVGAQRKDYLASYADLATWSGHAQVLADDQVATLLRAATQHPRQAAAVFEQAMALRETLYQIFTAVAARLPAAAADLEALQAAYVATIAQSRLAQATEGYRWRWPGGTQALEQLLWPIICSAIDLLTSPEARRVKVCPGLGDCGWLFLDTSKSGRRRWCSMESCGSRSKMRRYYARTHGHPIG